MSPAWRRASLRKVRVYALIEVPFLATLLGAGRLEDVRQLRAVRRRLRLAFVPAPGAGLVVVEVHFAFLAPVAVPAQGVGLRRTR